MGLLGEVLEALHLAPRCRTVHASGRRWHDPDAIQASLGGRGTLVTMGTGPMPSADDPPKPFELWWRSDGVYRIDEEDRVQIQRDGTTTRYHPGMGGIRAPTGRGDTMSIVLAPQRVARTMTLDVVGEDRWHDRSVWNVSARGADADMQFGRRPLERWGLR